MAKPDLIVKIEKLTKNDAEYGRGGRSNPNNKPNGK